MRKETFLLKLLMQNPNPHTQLEKCICPKILRDTRFTLRPETIENRWDILYRDYPEVYDEFASVPYKPKWIDVFDKLFDLRGKTVADIGSGSGLSTFALAKKAKLVIGVEPEDAMRKRAIENAKKRRIRNVKFVKGLAEKIPLKNNSVDIVVAVTAPASIKEFTRIVEKGGLIVTIDVAPKWYGGELAPVICGKKRVTKEDSEGVRHRVLTQHNFKYKDFYQIQDYISLKKIIGTYGFIFGKKAIAYLKKHKKTTIKWKFRMHYKQLS